MKNLFIKIKQLISPEYTQVRNPINRKTMTQTIDGYKNGKHVGSINFYVMSKDRLDAFKKI